jgi:hypothetical protein
VNSSELDLYHLTGGLVYTIRGQNLITGLQYVVGRTRDQKQFVNLSHPVEWNAEEKAALQGNRDNTMKSFTNSISLYFGATFNFGGDKK